MRVLMTSDTVGGVWTYAIELAAGLAKVGVQTTFATMGRMPSPDQCRAAAAIPGLELKASRYQLEWQDDPWADVAAAGEWLLGLADEIRPDVVQINGYAHGALPFDAPVLVVAHSCVSTWWRAVLREEIPPRYDTYRAHVARGLAAASAVVAPTRAMLDGLERSYAVPVRDARVIHNGIDVSRFSGASPKDAFVLAAGRLWDASKNLVVLDAVAEKVSWPIRVAGDPTPPEGTFHVVTRHVDLLGRLPREALAVCMSRAAIACHPASYEPFGLVPLEAAASGCALVLSDIPTLREVWQDAASYASPDDPDAFAAAVQRLIDRPDEREALASRARARSAMFDSRRQVLAYHQLYRELIDRAAHEPPRPPRPSGEELPS